MEEKLFYDHLHREENVDPLANFAKIFVTPLTRSVPGKPRATSEILWLWKGSFDWKTSETKALYLKSLVVVSVTGHTQVKGAHLGQGHHMLWTTLAPTRLIPAGLSAVAGHSQGDARAWRPLHHIVTGSLHHPRIPRKIICSDMYF